ncbi:MAG: 4-hydroxy-tetrahydrodipicolinate synthase [Theionarchaea archaeon]|nr:4-hydroxy-tetrahydrodipicolinate synthase [Theionarchaea archaeon]
MRVKGSWVAVPTPFNEDGSVNYDGFNLLIDFHRENNTDGLLVLGSAGEASMLTPEEKKKITECVTDYARNRIPVFIGTTGSNTAESVCMTRVASDCGADGAMLVVPGYIRPPPEDIYSFFEKVASAVKIPIAVYNNPTRVGVTISTETAIALSRIDNIVAFKEAIPDISHLIKMKKAVGDSVDILTCDSPQFSIIMPNLAFGGSGTANITGNLAPEEFAQLSSPWKTFEDVIQCRDLIFRYFELMQLCYSVTNPVVIKAGLNLLGLKVGKPRPPLQELDSQKTAVLKTLLGSLGLLDKYQT